MTNDFRNFDQLKTNELFITRHKWFKPYYELTDEQFIYGKLYRKSLFSRRATIETAEGTWTIKCKGLFKRSSLIVKGEDETIGTLIPATWKRNIDLQMDNGFRAFFNYKKLFSMAYVLTHEMYGDILQIKQKAFGIKKPYVITFDQTLQISDRPPLPLLMLIGVNAMLIRQEQAAAAS
ncbi:hypothetical protein FFF34_006750 [Inquilinus sp. KBS0705]|nr:hypothetical protein FFF34_006750 [Inquilinus sp. KBS0705]